MAKKTYVLDTSVCLTDSSCIYRYENNDILFPLKVLEEVDAKKKRQDGVGANARGIIRALDAFRAKGSLSRGVRIGRGYGLLTVRGHNNQLLPHDLSPDHPDHVIIATALAEKNRVPNRRVIVVTRDINMRVICDSLKIESEDYTHNQAVNDAEQIFCGFKEFTVEDSVVDDFYAGEDVFLEPQVGLYPNLFVMLTSESNEKKTALAKFVSSAEPLQKINKHNMWGITPRNKEQMFAVDLLMDPNIPIVSLVGKAGCGKTLMAIAAGLEQVLNMTVETAASKKVTTQYKRMIVSRPVQPLGKDIGFLPGTMEEKMIPWLMPIQDNLQFLMGDNKATLEMYMENGTIEIEALTYIRGRSISNAFIIIDEAQNLTAHELKTIITRVGEGTKVVLTGDVEQIDNVYVDSTSNGLTNAVEKFKDHSVAGHITFQKGERSKVATLAAKIL